MKAYTFESGSLVAGLSITNDEKLGQVLFLGEAGRGRRYEKVALGRQNPAKVVNGRVIEAHPHKITLPVNGGKPEKVFYVLERPRGASWDVLVRVNTYGGYIRNGRGYWQKVAGAPEALISGYGAFGDAGRIGNWDDGLVVMHPGDVLKIHPSRSWGAGPSALWVDEHGEIHSASWQDYENITAVEKAQDMIAEAEAQPTALNFMFGTMPLYTWRGGSVENGLRLTKGATGLVVELGEKGRGRHMAEVPLVGEAPMAPCPKRNDSHGWYCDRQPEDRDISTCSYCGLRYEVVQGERIQIAHPADNGEVPGVLAQAAVGQLSEKVRGLVTDYNQTEAGSCLVRINTSGGYTRRGNGYWKPWKGQTVTVAAGHGADGDAGGIGTWEDELLVMHEGDVIYATPAGSAPLYAVFVKGGKVLTELWVTWKIEDAKRDPQFYIAKGTAPWGHVPQEWMGKVVTVKELETSRDDGSYLTERHTGEVVSINPLKLNLGWDNRDYHEVEVSRGTWINLEADKVAKRPQGEAAEQRQIRRAQAEEVKKQALEVTQQSYFNLFSDSLQEDVQKLAREDGFDLMPSGDGYGSLASWVSSGQSTLSRVTEVTEEAKELERLQNAGEIIVNFTAWHRRGGMTSNGDGWVICADGTLRQRDSDTVPRHKSDGTYHWDLVNRQELALVWQCSHMGDVSGNSTFTVAHLPIGGPTTEQLAAVMAIEEEIGAPIGAFGLNPEAKKAAEKRMQAICDAAQKILGYTPEFTYYQVAGNNGVMLAEDSGTFRINLHLPFNQWCDGRNAQIVRSIRAADGMLEFLAYEKYGQTNIAMRWRELTEEEKSPIVAAAQPVQTTGAETKEASVSEPQKMQWKNLGKGWWKCPQGHTAKSKAGEPTACKFCK